MIFIEKHVRIAFNTGVCSPVLKVMKGINIIICVVFLGHLARGQKCNENLFKLRYMSDWDYRVVIISGILLEKDLCDMARLVRRAHDFGFNTSHLKGMVLDHLLINSQAKKFKNFVKFLNQNKIYKSRDVKESLAYVGMKCSEPINKFLFSKSNLQKKIFADLLISSPLLMKEEGEDSLLDFTEINRQLIEGEIFSDKKPTFEHFFYILCCGIKNVKLKNLQQFFTLYKKLRAGTDDAMGPGMLMHESLCLDSDFLPYIDETSAAVAREIIEFSKSENLLFIDYPSIHSYNLKSAFPDIHDSLFCCMNPDNLNYFTLKILNAGACFTNGQMDTVQFIEFLRNLVPKTEGEQMMLGHFLPNIAKTIFIKNTLPNETELDQTRMSNFWSFLILMFKNEHCKVKSWKLGQFISLLIIKKRWNLLHIVLKFIEMNDVSVSYESHFYIIRCLEIHELQPDLLEKILSIILIGKKQFNYQKLFFTLQLFNHKDFSPHLIKELQKIDGVRDAMARFFLKKAHSTEYKHVGSGSPNKFSKLIKYMRGENLLSEVDQRLRIEHYKFSKIMKNGLIKTFNRLLEYISVLDVKAFEQIGVERTIDFVHSLIRIIGSTDSVGLVSCFSGISARLAVSGLHKHLHQLFMVVLSLEENGDLPVGILASMSIRACEAALDGNSVESLEEIITFFKGKKEIAKISKEVCETIVTTDSHFREILTQLCIEHAFIVNEKAVKYLLYSSLMSWKDAQAICSPTHTLSSTEIMRQIAILVYE